LLGSEQIALESALDDVFGNNFVQVGHWGPPDAFLPLARIPRRFLIADPGYRGDCVSHASSLALQTQSVDAVLLPHTLEFEPEPQAVLREVERVLTGEGHVLVFGFEPAGLWALRHRLTPGGFPPGLHRTLSRRRLRDWLSLLGFDVVQTTRIVRAPPVLGLAAGRFGKALEWAQNPLEGRFGSVYLIKAKKRLYTLTPIRPKRRRRPAIVGTAVENA
jgi:SAM-dependent methyltransferase